MPAESGVNVGVAGVGGRGGALAPNFQHFPDSRLHALCDIDQDALDEAAATFDVEHTYTEYADFVSDGAIDAVVLGTPLDVHVEQAVAALENDVHVLSEVPAASSVDECRTLVEAVESSRAQYMMAENFNYTRTTMLVRNLVEAGRFGEPYYAEGITYNRLDAPPDGWRRDLLLGRNGVTYPTHTLGPILSWLPDDRIDRVKCVGSGHHHSDENEDRYAQEDTTLLLGRTERDRLVRIRQDFLSKRPPKKEFQIQGTAGCFESARSRWDPDKIWLEPDTEGGGWEELYRYEDDFLPECWRDPPEPVRDGTARAFFVCQRFVESVARDEPVPIDVHAALDMTLPGLVSRRSIEHDGAWVTVPNSRNW